MKNFLLTALLFVTTFITVKAQDDAPPTDKKEGQKRIQALYVAYITRELKLTAEEAQKFWPVHTQFANEVQGVKKDLPELERQQAVLNIKKKYQEKFIPILGNDRCERFFRLDGEFRKKLLERIRKRQGQGPRMKRGV